MKSARQTVLYFTVAVLSTFPFFGYSSAEVTGPSVSNPGVKYKSGKDLNFEDLLIQGALKRPDLVVITGDLSQSSDELLSLRTDFLDRVTGDAGGEISVGKFNERTQ